MHKIGDYVMYGGGIMHIVDKSKETFADTTKEYYILEEANSGGGSKTYVPADNEKLLSNMRTLLSKSEIEALLARYDEIPAAEWHSDNRIRTDSFKRIIDSCDRAALVGMIKSINKMAEERQAQGKKNFITDMNALAKAEKLLHSEVAFVLGISEADVPKYIKERITK